MSGAARRGEGAVVAVAMVYPTLAAWLYFRTFADAAWMPGLYAVAKAVQFGLPLAWWLHAGASGWRPAPRPGSVGIGLATGLGIVVLVAGAWWVLARTTDLAEFAAPRVAERVEAVGAAGPVGFLVMAGFLALAHSFLEEYYWRWFVHGRLRARLRRKAATLASSLAFMAHHVIILHSFLGAGRHLWATVLLSASVAGAGALWAWLYERSRGLGPAWISHALADVAILAVGHDLVH